MKLNRNMLKDESGQGAAEYILLFGGVIVIAISALLVYKQYFKSGVNFNAAEDSNNVRGSINKSS
jgi:Flp pilus assembly pilin Flp